MAFETNADGSTKRIFVQQSGLNGFVVVDFPARKIATHHAARAAGGRAVTEVLEGSPSRGFGVTPDNKTLCVNSRLNTPCTSTRSPI